MNPANYAQTNIQLYRQLIAKGYSEEDVLLVKNGYDLAVVLFFSMCRASNKPFVCHLVGVGSILADLKMAPEVLVAGLTHSVYLYGNFGDKKRGVSGRKRDFVRSIIGDKSEDYVFAYTEKKWSNTLLEEICRQVDSLSTFDRNLVVIKLADILEEYIDAGLAYTPKRILHATNPNLDESLDVVIGLAKSLCSKEWSERYLSYVMSCREYQPAEVLLRDDKRLWHVNRKRLKELGYQVPWFERLRGWF